MRHLVAIAVALLFSVTTAFAADPVGKYTIEGNDPGGGGTYTGTVTVERTGNTFKVTWQVGSDTYVGTGLGDREFLAVSYKLGEDTGLALYSEDGGNWVGVWTPLGASDVGTETWKRK